MLYFKMEFSCSKIVFDPHWKFSSLEFKASSCHLHSVHWETYIQVIKCRSTELLFGSSTPLTRFSCMFVKPFSDTSISIIKYFNKYRHSQVNFTHQKRNLPERHLAQNIVKQEHEPGMGCCFFIHILLHLCIINVAAIYAIEGVMIVHMLVCGCIRIKASFMLSP